MEHLLWFVITITVGIAGAIIAMKLKVPAGGILGAMIAVVIINVFIKGNACFFNLGKVLVQISVGALAGCKVGKKELKKMISIPSLLLIVFLMEIIYTVIFGIVINKTCTLDTLTSLYLVAPGGLTDIMLIAEEAGVDNTSMAVVQLLRVLVFNGIFPPIFCALAVKLKDPRSGAYQNMNESGKKECDIQSPERYLIKNKTLRLCGLLVFSGLGGMMMRMTGIEGGTIIGAMLFSIIYSCMIGKTEVPLKFKRFQQVMLGTYVGSGIYLVTLTNIKNMVIPILFVALNLFIVTFFTAWIIRKTGKLDTMSSLTCSSPGGLAEMLMLTDELGGDVSTVAMIHSFRLILVVTVFPPFLRIIADFIY